MEVSFQGSIEKRKLSLSALNPAQRQGAANLACTPNNEQEDAGGAGLLHSLSCAFLPRDTKAITLPLQPAAGARGLNFQTTQPLLYFQQRFRMEVAQMLATAVNWQSSVGKLMFTILSRKLQPCPCGKGGERSNINIGNVCPIRRTAVSSHSQLQDETLQVICCCCGCGR